MSKLILLLLGLAGLYICTAARSSTDENAEKILEFTHGKDDGHFEDLETEADEADPLVTEENEKADPRPACPRWLTGGVCRRRHNRHWRLPCCNKGSCCRRRVTRRRRRRRRRTW